LSSLNFSDEFSKNNHKLVKFLLKKSNESNIDLIETISESKFLVALFKSKDKKEMQQAMIKLKDNMTYLLAFSTLSGLVKWNSEARPLPLSAREVTENVNKLELNGFIIDINEEHRFKVDEHILIELNRKFFPPDYKSEDLRKELLRIVADFPEIDSISIEDSINCSARIIFHSKNDISDQVIEISQKLRENQEILLLAPQGLDLLVQKN